jgi:sialic acid synthase SpsE
MKDFIHAAHETGCTGVKFQLFKIDNLFAQEILVKSETHSKRKDWELPDGYIPELSELAHKLGLKFSCTPFYLDAVDILEPYVDFYKIASYELLWLDLFKKCGNTGKPIIFSTGMATLNEVQVTLDCIINTQCKDITILHCNSAYPTPVKDANLAGIQDLRNMISTLNIPKDVIIKIGYSDHTVSPAVMYRAVHRFGIKFIEFHMDLDGKGEEYSAGHCWLPGEIEEVISNVNSGFLADGDGKYGPSASELPEREWRADPSDGLRPLKHIRKSY